jgi:hypothetical protein
MCKKLIYLIISFVLVLVFTSPSHAAYLDAVGGDGGNTVNAST